MAKSIRDPQLRLRIYHTTFASMRRAIVEKAREYGVPVIPVNPAFTSSKCPIHGQKSSTNPMGALLQGLVDAPWVVNYGIGTWLHYIT